MSVTHTCDVLARSSVLHGKSCLIDQLTSNLLSATWSGVKNSGDLEGLHSQKSAARKWEIQGLFSQLLSFLGLCLKFSTHCSQWTLPRIDINWVNLATMSSDIASLPEVSQTYRSNHVDSQKSIGLFVSQNLYKSIRVVVTLRTTVCRQGEFAYVVRDVLGERK